MHKEAISKFRASVSLYAAFVMLALLNSHAALAQTHNDGHKAAPGEVADLMHICGDDSSQQKVTVPAELAPFVPSNATAVEWHRADLNLDGLQDYFLVIERHCDERTLLLIVRELRGGLTLAASSSQIITCRSCRGQYSGYHGALVGRGFFSVAQESGSAAGGMSEKVTFV